MICNALRNKGGYFVLLSFFFSVNAYAGWIDAPYHTIIPFPGVDIYEPDTYRDEHRVIIRGSVIIPACSVDGIALSENYVKQVNLGLYSQSTIESNSTSPVTVPFIIHCNSSYSGNISLTYFPYSNNSIDEHRNMIKVKNNNSIAIELTKDGQGNDRHNLVLGQAYELVNFGGRYDASFNARVVKYPNLDSGLVKTGVFEAGLIIGIRYN